MNKVIHGDCFNMLPTLDDNSVDAIVTDPPYELGFMHKKWDTSGIAYNVDLWRECLRVLKPGGHLLSFGGSRTYHRMACAIEDAGFEIRDQIQWIYGSGFPKSQNISKAMDGVVGKQGKGFVSAGDDGRKTEFKQDLSKRSDYGYIWEPTTENAKRWEGWGSALKPAHEPIVLARKPLSEKTIAANVLKWGTGGINIDKCRVGTDEVKPADKIGGSMGYHGRGKGSDRHYGNGTSCPQGRFPANLIHDGSDEVVQGFPQARSAGNYPTTFNNSDGGYGEWAGKDCQGALYSDSGSAARFFYCAKASKAERNMGCEGLEVRPKKETYGDGFNSATKCDPKMHTSEGVAKRPMQQNSHPTVKPLALMRYLCRLITPPNGTVLDPFAGSGSTLIAAKQEGFNFIGIEMEEEYIKIAECRLQAVTDEQLSIV